MKEMNCLDCNEGPFRAETPEGMMQNMMSHYLESHQEMMDGQNEETKEEWMSRFNKEWDFAEEL